MTGRGVVCGVMVACVLVVGHAEARGPALRGVIEGYYGRPWTGDARRDVIRFLGAHGLNAFVYAPKNDEFHRAHWRDPYDDAALADLRATAATARRARVKFVYALSPVLDVCYSCADDFTALTAKLTQLAHARIRRFALLFDDGGQLTASEDVAQYGGTDPAALARAQADLVNRTRRWLRAHRTGTLVLMVPSDYAGTECHPYHAALATALAGRVPIGWTGPGVFAEAITAADAQARAACLPRHPVVLWDNFPVNDTVLSNNLHLGPLTGRDAGLPRTLRGYLLNPMTQAHASLVALGTAAAYLRNPARYQPERAWANVLAELSGGGTGLPVFAAQVRSSALDLRDAVELGTAVDGAAATFAGADWMPAVSAVATALAPEAAAPADIAMHLGGTPLGDEIAPWVAELGAHVTRSMDAVALLSALKPTFTALGATATGGGLHVTGRAFGPDFGTAARFGPGFAADAVAAAARIADPPFDAYFACLGDLTGADIAFCPQFGLNVHGKMLFVLIHTISDISLVSDRNVFERLVIVAGSAYAEWAARQGPGSDALTVTADGAPVPIDGAGFFDVTVPAPSGHSTLVVTTAAGDATSRTVP